MDINENEKVEYFLGKALDEVMPSTYTNITNEQLNGIAYALAKMIVIDCASELEREALISHDEGTPSYKVLKQEAAWMKMRYGVE